MVDIKAILKKAQESLLDTTGNNRLINPPRSASRTSRLEVVREKSDEVFRRLVAAGKSMEFLPAAPRPENPKGAKGAVVVNEEKPAPGTQGLLFSRAEDQGLLFQPEEEGDPANRSHETDKYLQTTLESEKLQTRLRRLYQDAQMTADARATTKGLGPARLRKTPCKTPPEPLSSSPSGGFLPTRIPDGYLLALIDLR